MHIICDQNDVIQDMASETQNLSRGFGFRDYKYYDDPKISFAQIGDIYKDGVLVSNEQLRQERLFKYESEQKIQSKMRDLAIIELKKAGELPVDFIDTK